MTSQKTIPLKSPFVIIGHGKSGLSAYNLLVEHFKSKNHIYIFDEKKPSDFKTWDDIASLTPGTLIISPGVPLQSTALQKLKDLGWIISSEISLASYFITTEKIIGITGSVAKSTVTTLLGEAIQFLNQNNFVGGNIGTPFCDYALKLLKGSSPAEWIVLELSSYQLENCENLKLHSSGITFLSANHLERYNSIQDYYLTKFNICKITQTLSFFNQSSEDLKKYSEYVKTPYKFVNAQTKSSDPKLKTALIGQHNKDNFALALAIAQHCGFSDQAIEQMQKFKGLSHRLEYVGLIQNVHYINDSKATAMDSVKVAVSSSLEMVSSSNKLHLILGGKDKNLPWHELSELKSDPRIQFYFFGECGELAAQKMNISNPLYVFSLEACFQKIVAKTTPQDVVLLSPGGTSLDQFKNFEERGDFFKKLASQLIKMSNKNN